MHRFIDHAPEQSEVCRGLSYEHGNVLIDNHFADCSIFIFAEKNGMRCRWPGKLYVTPQALHTYKGDCLLANKVDLISPELGSSRIRQEIEQTILIYKDRAKK